MLYDYRCLECGADFEELSSIEASHEVLCPVCGKTAQKVINTKVNVSIFPEGLWHNIGPKPIYIKSASQLAEECRKRWTPTNKPWPELLDGISHPGLPNDVKYKGAEGHKTKEELCRMKTERLARTVEKVQQARVRGVIGN